MEFKESPYTLENVATGRTFSDTGWLLSDPEYPQPSLLRTLYEKKQLQLKEERYGFYRFADWLPLKRYLQRSAPPITYHSQALGKALGLKNLYVTFNGFWPQKGALMESCSFKETEAYAVCGRLEPDNNKTLVVASAGNTARAFARVCSDNQIPLLLCVPHANLDALWFDKPIDACVRLVSTPKGSDYFDAIQLSQKFCLSDPFIEEGGARNVARRDGMGTTVLSAAFHIGTIPDYYIQAVGSGTGAIAAHEANLRLIRDGRFGDTVMKLITVQNHPFTPVYKAWKMGSRSLLPFDDDTARLQAHQIDAKVLANRKPPYSIPGGLFDALTDSNGLVCTVTNQEIEQAAALFEAMEGVDIHPAAAAALAGLRNEVAKGTIDKKKIVLLNITGGGEKRFKNSKKRFQKYSVETLQ
ncbi:MAG: cysteate synthase [Bacteroidales bacterium]|nr:cysteate synthase [Bacteroidales bacterium]